MKYNAKAKIAYTVGLKSACITAISENWINSDNTCNAVLSDLTECGAAEVVQCIGVDLSKEGSFVVSVNILAHVDDAPEYEITHTTERVFSDLLKRID